MLIEPFVIGLKSLERRKDPRISLFKDRPGSLARFFVAQRIAVLGMSGAGKSVTGAVLAEEFTKVGLLQCIIDTEGDYVGLRDWRPDKYSIFGRRFSRQSKGISTSSLRTAVSRLIGVDDAGMVVDKRSVILLLNDYDKSRRLEIIHEFLSLLWDRVRFDRPSHAIMLFVDELHEKAPQMRAGNIELATLLEDIAKLGRKRGLGFVGLSQRPAEVSKSVLAQCTLYFFHRVRIMNDLKTYQSYMGVDVFGNRPDGFVRRAVRLKDGEVVFSHPPTSEYDSGLFVAQVRMRESVHTSKNMGLSGLSTPPSVGS